MSGKRWALLFAAVALICAVCLVWMSAGRDTRGVIISQNGVIVERIDLSKVSAPYTLRFEWEGGYNLVEVRSDTVEVIEADCSNQVCVQHGALQEHGSPITCLPHRLSITWAESGYAG